MRHMRVTMLMIPPPGAAPVSRRLAAVIAFCALAGSVRAQSATPLIGRWTVEYEVGRKMEDGDVTPIRGSGRMIIAPSGDSLLVTIQAPPRPDGTVPPPATVGARSSDGSTTFTQKQQVRVNLNGEESTRDVVLTWSLKASGDVITGTLTRAMQDAPAMLTPSPVSGARVKA